MQQSHLRGPRGSFSGRPLLLLGVLLGLVLTVLFARSFLPGMATFSNDGPLGLMRSRVYEVPGALRSAWNDLNWLGADAGNLPPSASTLAVLCLGPFGSSKFYPALTLFALGISAGLLFRQLGMRPVVCVLGGLAAALNSDFFSYTCWGLGSLTLCVASVMLAMAALVSTKVPVWMRVVLAGAALGHGLVEGFDNGAILSLYVAAFAVACVAFDPRPASIGSRLRTSVGWVAGIAVVSAVVASHVLVSLVQVNITGAVGMGQDSQSKVERWHFATQWSLPPEETLRVVIPGLFGYRMDTLGGGQYWGRVGMDPAWDRYWAASDRTSMPRPGGVLRYSGAGHYAGVLVVLLALFAVAQSFRKGGGALTPMERRWVWFWAGAALISLLLAFGRFAPFYRFFYLLPYASTIRNPVKFLHPFSLSLVVLFAYGLQALWRGWVDSEGGSGRGGETVAGRAERRRVGGVVGRSWIPGSGWEAGWCKATLVVACLAPLAWNRHAAAQPGRVRYLQEAGFTADAAPVISAFATREVGCFVAVLAVSVALVVLVLGGWLAGRRSGVAAGLLAVVLLVDLGRADLPWIRYYDWRELYAPHAITDILRAAPHEARVAGRMPFKPVGTDLGSRLQAGLATLYDLEWLQQQFRFYDIQSLDVVQMSRVASDQARFSQAFAAFPAREWELCNVRFLVTLVGVVDSLNEVLDPVKRRFRVHTGFELERAAGVHRVRTNTVGPYALVQFLGALPRAKLYSRWQRDVPDADALARLVSPHFHPEADVLISLETPAPPPPASASVEAVDSTAPPSSSARHVHYSPKRFVIATEAQVPSILLVNDRYDPRWRVRVDGREAPLLKANFVMRGVWLEAGQHEVEFVWSPPAGWLLVSAASMLGTLGLLGYVGLAGRGGRSHSEGRTEAARTRSGPRGSG